MITAASFWFTTSITKYGKVNVVAATGSGYDQRMRKGLLRDMGV